MAENKKKSFWDKIEFVPYDDFSETDIAFESLTSSTNIYFPQEIQVDNPLNPGSINYINFKFGMDPDGNPFS